MPQTPTTLELLVLGLVKQGIKTAYELKARAGISVGASHPLLKRLEQAGLLRCRRAQSGRHRQEFMLSAQGRALLKTATARQIRKARSEPPWDTESLLRIAAIGILSGRPREAKAVLAGAIRKFAEPTRKVSPKPPTTLAGQYQWMITLLQRRRRRADAEVLREISNVIFGSAL